MKEMYVKPLIEKIAFDNADIITASADEDTEPTTKKVNEGCDLNPSGKNKNKHFECAIY